MQITHKLLLQIQFASKGYSQQRRDKQSKLQSIKLRGKLLYSIQTAAPYQRHKIRHKDGIRGVKNKITARAR